MNGTTFHSITIIVDNVPELRALLLEFRRSFRLAKKTKDTEQITKKQDDNEIRKLNESMEVASEIKKKKIHKGICHIENQWYGGFCFKCFQTWQKASLPIYN